jgi:putative endonuclease
MAAHNELGEKGERLAIQYLVKLGYQILETNWRYSRAEVDIIAMDGPVLVFLEVKTRATAAFGRPEEFITARKERLLTDAAHAYIDQVNHEWEVRFDFISIIFRSDDDYEVEHFKDAFFPGLE